MALQPRRLLGRFKALPRVLRAIAAVAAIDLVVLIFASLLLEDEVGDRIDRDPHQRVVAR